MPEDGGFERQDIIQSNFAKIGYTTSMKILGNQVPTIFELDTIVTPSEIFQCFIANELMVEIYWDVLEAILERYGWVYTPSGDDDGECTWTRLNNVDEVFQAAKAVEELIDQLGYGEFTMVVYENEI